MMGFLHGRKRPPGCLPDFRDHVSEEARQILRGGLSFACSFHEAHPPGASTRRHDFRATAQAPPLHLLDNVMRKA
eukprot:CAMPEP_0197644838 /NCGR_PEP_ID=MMETSP1338-20131121/17685_1 /TAXON_ID=43686 ORGANISM="Pelagodinium beii, Strain RCC1491" /NCGR_SAMPLE_ID=MMETSP1338 /ASSEMBLY_ACC=CAM_ASM_000754 /LENGTH=74 /DNA_ID=CAMNT_0043218299 /DNA_START=178 /DNA_END=402 /DNA_ORIENTATION=-